MVTKRTGTRMRTRSSRRAAMRRLCACAEHDAITPASTDSLAMFAIDYKVQVFKIL